MLKRVILQKLKNHLSLFLLFMTTENVFNPFCVQITGIMLDWAHYFVFT